jgi:hypothetical protein
MVDLRFIYVMAMETNHDSLQILYRSQISKHHFGTAIFLLSLSLSLSLPLSLSRALSLVNTHTHTHRHTHTALALPLKDGNLCSTTKREKKNRASSICYNIKTILPICVQRTISISGRRVRLGGIRNRRQAPRSWPR